MSKDVAELIANAAQKLFDKAAVGDRKQGSYTNPINFFGVKQFEPNIIYEKGRADDGRRRVIMGSANLSHSASPMTAIALPSEIGADMSVFLRLRLLI